MQKRKKYKQNLNIILAVRWKCGCGISWIAFAVRRVAVISEHFKTSEIFIFRIVVRKYFHKAICQSGTALHEWLIQTDPVGKSKKVAELLGFEGGSQLETLGKMGRLPRLADHERSFHFRLLTERKWFAWIPKTFRKCLERRWETTWSTYEFQAMCWTKNGMFQM